MKDTENQIFKRLENLYFEMDRVWEKTASLYGFICNGCDENCCESEFYHHTFIEKKYLLKGFKQMPTPQIVATTKRAKKVCTKRDIAAKKQEIVRIMCPLNQDGKCILYKYRPMICRLHGIPHELIKPAGYSSILSANSIFDTPSIPLFDSKPVFSPGCKAGSGFFNAKEYIKFDRTPFYLEMAAIERDYITASIGKVVRNRQTIAQMIVRS